MARETHIRIGDQSIPLLDAGAAPLHADLICEARHYNGTLAIGLAALIADDEGLKAMVLGRVRMNVVAAQNLHAVLGQMIADALKPADTSKAN